MTVELNVTWLVARDTLIDGHKVIEIYQFRKGYKSIFKAVELWKTQTLQKWSAYKIISKNIWMI